MNKSKSKSRSKGRQQLLIQYMEGISWRVMEDYPALVRKVIRGRAGVYALYRRETLYYVGLAGNLMGRIKGHLKDRHTGVWDRFSVYLTANDEHMRELETLLLRIVRPRGNRVSGRLAGADDLKAMLNREMSNADADRRARILGGFVARRRRKSKTARGGGSLPLAGVVDRRIPLKAKWKGKTYKATLRKDGQISFRQHLYLSPSAAGKAVVKHGVNGWDFWQYKSPSKRWEPLSAIRK